MLERGPADVGRAGAGQQAECYFGMEKKPLFFRDTGQLGVGTDAGDRDGMTCSCAWRGGKGQRERGHFPSRACVLPH